MNATGNNNGSKDKTMTYDMSAPLNVTLTTAAYTPDTSKAHPRMNRRDKHNAVESCNNVIILKGDANGRGMARATVNGKTTTGLFFIAPNTYPKHITANTGMTAYYVGKSTDYGISSEMGAAVWFVDFSRIGVKLEREAQRKPRVSAAELKARREAATRRNEAAVEGTAIWADLLGIN